MPVIFPNSPGKHGRQKDCPTCGLLVPSGHASHVSPSVLLLRPLSHFTHGTKAFAELLVQPAGQLKQNSSPSRLICPGGQVLQFCSDTWRSALVPMSSRNFPAPHFVQSAWPGLSANRPFGQMVHEVEPFEDANVPSLQSRHWDIFSCFVASTRASSTR